MGLEPRRPRVGSAERLPLPDASADALVFPGGDGRNVRLWLPNVKFDWNRVRSWAKDESEPDAPASAGFFE